MPTKSFDNKIAIVGMSCIFPQAPNVRQFWLNNVNGVDAVIDKPASRWPTHSNWDLPPDHEAYLATRKAGYLEDGVLFDPVRLGIVPNLVKHGDPDQFLMLELIDKALADANIADDDPIRERTDVIIGRGGYATGKVIELSLRAELYDDILQMLERKFPEMLAGRRDQVEAYLRSTLTNPVIDNVSTAVSNIAASRPANRFNLRGAAYLVDGACASSLIAVESAVWRLRTHQSDMAVAAGQFITMNPTFFHFFTRLGAVSPSQVIRPFDRRADGLMVGEGGGAIILKRLEDAIRNEDQIYAVVSGVGSSSDGLGLDVLAPNPTGQILAIGRAYKDCGIDPLSIGYLECHGTGTAAGDAAEIESIHHCFGTYNTPPTQRAMGSVKSMIGHTMPAAGMASIIRVAMALSNKIIPPSLHCEQPREEILSSAFYINTQTRPWIHSASSGPRRAGINAFGFGGVNVHVVLEETPTTSPSVQVAGFSPKIRPIEGGLRRETEIALWSAPSIQEMETQIERFADRLRRAPVAPLLADVAYTLAEEIDIRHPVKLAIIARDSAELATQLGEALANLRRPNAFDQSETIYFSDQAAKPPGKTAFILPGMGFPGLVGTYPDHLLEMCIHYPEIREEFDFFEERDRHPDDTVPTSSIFSPPASLPEDVRKQLKSRLAPPKADSDFSKETNPQERYLSAMGVTLANWVSWILLEKFKIPVEMITGQSQGEMAAVSAAGCANFREGAPAFWKFLDLDTRDRLGGRLAFAWATTERLEELVAQHPGTYIAIYMAPTSSIFGGDREGLEAICEILRQEEVLVQILPFPPIHTPSLSGLKEELRAKLESDNFEIRPPVIPLYSSITASLYPNDSAGIKEHLLYNVDKPLRVWQTIRTLYREGARVFVQVGGGHTATHMGFLLPDDADPVVTAATDVDTRNPITQLNHLVATLFTAGVSIDPSPLFEYRTAHALNADLTRSDAPSKQGLKIPLRIDWMPIYSPVVPPPSEPAPISSTVNIAPPEPTPAEPTPVASSLPLAPAAEVDARDALPFERNVLDRLPVLGRVLACEPGQSITIERVITLESDPYLIDHLFMHAPPKPITHRFPVVPLTMSLEFAAEAAFLLSPGEGLIGFENIRATRWIGLREVDSETLRIEAKLVGYDPETMVRRLDVKFYASDALSFSTIALFSTAYRNDLYLDIVDSSADGPWPIHASQIYSERYMFHGPAFQVLQELDTFGNPGASAKVEVFPKDKLFANIPDPILFTDPCLMDGIGQVVGIWALFFGSAMLPTSADRIEFYCPTPPVGTRAPIRMECLHFSDETRQIRAHVEIQDGQGNVWVRIENWAEWILNYSTEYIESTRMPQWFLSGQEMPLPGMPEGTVCVQLDREFIVGPDLEWVRRIFLHDSEMSVVTTLPNNKQKREVLASRIVAKDAARLWWALQHGVEYPYPCEFVINHDENGAPFLAPAGDPSLPHISIAHSDATYVALASNQPVGIDIEPESRDTSSYQDHFLTPEEASRANTLDSQMPEEVWALRFWCAKEALGKMLRIGLEGRPKQFEILDVSPTGLLSLRHRHTGTIYDVQTFRWNAMVYAYAVGGQPAASNPGVLLSHESSNS